MKTPLALASFAALSLNLAACSVNSDTHHHHHHNDKMAAPSTSSGSNFMRVVNPASDEQQSALLGRIKSLEGTWENADQPGKVAAIYEVSSNGSVVRETMMPGTPHEMTNMYHMDGDTLVMTHYCAVGNQPRMRAHASTVGGDSTIALTPDSVTNLRSADEHCMASMTIHFIDNNTIRQDWRGYKNNLPEGEQVSFILKRKS